MLPGWFRAREIPLRRSWRDCTPWLPAAIVEASPGRRSTVTTDAERVFVDTNVLLAATDTDRDVHGDAMTFLRLAGEGSCRLFVTGQIFREYLVVATRPVEVNGLGLSPEDAVGNVNQFQEVVQLLPENADCAQELSRFVRELGLKGKRIHDANVVASMFAHGLRYLKTYNPSDFSTFADVTCL